MQHDQNFDGVLINADILLTGQDGPLWISGIHPAGHGTIELQVDVVLNKSISDRYIA
jgi:hypothetical protein